MRLPTDRGWVRFFARVMLGLIFLMYGWYKCFTLTPMAHAQRFFTGPYADTWIPQWLLITLGLAIPPLELIGGALLVIGLGVRPVLIVFGVLLLTVTYGHLLKDPRFDLAHVIFLRLILLAIALVMPAEEDTLSVDAWLAKPGRRHTRMDAD